MLRNLGIRAKVLAVLAIPLVVLAALAAYVAVQAGSTAVQAERVSQLTGASRLLNQLVHELQRERSLTDSVLHRDGGAKAKAALTTQRIATDARLDAVRQAVAQAPIEAISPAFAGAVAKASAQHDQLRAARAQADAADPSVQTVLAYYGATIATDLGMVDLVANVSDDQDLSNELRAYGHLTKAIEAAWQERDLVGPAFDSKRISSDDYYRYAGLVRTQEEELAAAEQLADPTSRLQLRKTLATSAQYDVVSARQHVDELLFGANSEPKLDWRAVADTRINALESFEPAIAGTVASMAADVATRARTSALVVGLGTLTGVVLLVLLAVLLARRIVVPVRRVTEAARRTAASLPAMVEKLQAPGTRPDLDVEVIPVDSTDEIGQLAASFNAVNEVTRRVAEEQAALRASIAEMFVNVARRNQVLLSRQLGLIDGMEASEEDPDRLEKLFQVDHLATRMRRNAESLLVLAGIDANRRLRQPMPLTDVIRSAISEIESFERVDLAPAVDAPLVGRLAMTAAHMIAELVENATHFSNPETRVVVATGPCRDGVEVTITDYGLGMSEDDLAAANDTIAHPPVTEIAFAQRLGFFVVGRLAARLDATVRLRHGRSTGTIVTVVLPAELFVAGSLPHVQPAVEDAPARAALPAAASEAPRPVGAGSESSDAGLAGAGVGLAAAPSVSAQPVPAVAAAAPELLTAPAPASLASAAPAALVDFAPEAPVQQEAMAPAPTSLRSRLPLRRPKSSDPIPMPPTRSTGDGAGSDAGAAGGAVNGFGRHHDAELPSLVEAADAVEDHVATDEEPAPAAAEVDVEVAASPEAEALVEAEPVGEAEPVVDDRLPEELQAASDDVQPSDVEAVDVEVVEHELVVDDAVDAEPEALLADAEPADAEAVVEHVADPELVSNDDALNEAPHPETAPVEDSVEAAPATDEPATKADSNDREGEVAPVRMPSLLRGGFLPRRRKRQESADQVAAPIVPMANGDAPKALDAEPATAEGSITPETATAVAATAVPDEFPTDESADLASVEAVDEPAERAEVVSDEPDLAEPLAFDLPTFDWPSPRTAPEDHEDEAAQIADHAPFVGESEPEPEPEPEAEPQPEPDVLAATTPAASPTDQTDLHADPAEASTRGYAATVAQELAAANAPAPELPESPVVAAPAPLVGAPALDILPGKHRATKRRGLFGRRKGQDEAVPVPRASVTPAASQASAAAASGPLAAATAAPGAPAPSFTPGAAPAASDRSATGAGFGAQSADRAPFASFGPGSPPFGAMPGAVSGLAAPTESANAATEPGHAPGSTASDEAFAGPSWMTPPPRREPEAGEDASPFRPPFPAATHAPVPAQGAEGTAFGRSAQRDAGALPVRPRSPQGFAGAPAEQPSNGFGAFAAPGAGASPFGTRQPAADVPMPGHGASAEPQPAAGLPRRTPSEGSPFAPSNPDAAAAGEGVELMAMRAHLASQALSELSRLNSSSYQPATVADGASLARRVPRGGEAEQPAPATAAARKARSAEDVRSRLSGFRAGVERGRGEPAPAGSGDPARDH